MINPDDKRWKGCVWNEPDPPSGRVDSLTFDDAVERAIEEHPDEPPVTVEVAAWRHTVPDPKRMAGYVLGMVLERLDEEHRSDEGPNTEPTDDMREAEEAFIARVFELYEPDALEVAEVVEVDVAEWHARRSS